MSRTFLKHSAEQALLMAVVFGAGLLAQGQGVALADDSQPEGRIVAISPEGDVTAAIPQDDQEAIVAAPAYWIGVAGQEVTNPVLQTQLQLAADTGVIVEQVVPGSPAAKAGLRQHDIIIAVNGDVAHGMTELAEAVRSGAGEPIELKILRLAKEETVTVTPEERPADFTASLPAGQQVPEGFDAELGDLGQRLQGLLADPNGRGMRIMGPGMILRQQQAMGVPAGVSVSVTRENDGPAQITVTRGNESWTVTEGDEEAMKALPDDLRPFVEQMLGGQGRVGAFNFNFDLNELQQLLPDQLGNFENNAQLQAAQQHAQEMARRAQERAAQMRERTEASRRELMKRMEEMERRMQEMQQRLGAPQPPAAPAQPPVDDQTT
ncbi:MAG: PDZ domain-containing protein [Planctomycetales bacterium]|nr:PDZ domain-containing protein [Planctomycetales bacterium]